MATSSTATASLHLLLPASRRRRHFVPRAAHSESTPPPAASVDRRRFIAHTAAAAAVSPLVLPRWTPAARADDAPALSEWERVFLPIDPGVVLLDIAFVPDDPSHEDEDFNYRFNSVSFKGKEGWIIGKPAILLHTSDAGESWERIPLSAQLPGNMITEDFEEAQVQSRGFGILDVGYRSQEAAWAAGGSGVLLKTTNGGKNWVCDKAADNIAASLYSVKFLDDSKGFVLGNDGVLLRYLG
ncbi:unnamed protein product [Miscanthus lutarioriparius]|uniref:Photosynthesis system II assembly factor Ycf48/Hcf136-like domain-containing protein n=1 Tax=Miscanthus lutarioriparius TaxID=422564 RepID=A0A811S9J4_9POAL|nr:unnamed protein product [Miscanthus lutarioriparius]